MKHSPRLEASLASAPAAANRRKRADAAEAIPTLDEARKRLAASRGRAKPWLSPVVIESPEDTAELLGPEVYRKP
jgi:hypothetical protein